MTWGPSYCQIVLDCVGVDAHRPLSHSYSHHSCCRSLLSSAKFTYSDVSYSFHLFSHSYNFYTHPILTVTVPLIRSILTVLLQVTLVALLNTLAILTLEFLLPTTLHLLCQQKRYVTFKLMKAKQTKNSLEDSVIAEINNLKFVTKVMETSII